MCHRLLHRVDESALCILVRQPFVPIYLDPVFRNLDIIKCKTDDERFAAVNLNDISRIALDTELRPALYAEYESLLRHVVSDIT